jgi:hypothetical protein
VLRGNDLGLGACPTLPFYCGERSVTICVVLGQRKILNVFQRIHLWFFRVCGLASDRTSFASSRNGNVGQALSKYGIEKGKSEKEGTWQDGARRKILADRRCRRKSKIILIFGLDFTRLHQ